METLPLFERQRCTGIVIAMMGSKGLEVGVVSQLIAEGQVFIWQRGRKIAWQVQSHL